MNVSLTPELEQYIADKVATGMYQTTSEVIREALRALQQKEDYQAKLADLRREIDKGLADIHAGRTQPMTQELLETMKAEGRARLAAKKAGEKRRHA